MLRPQEVEWLAIFLSRAPMHPWEIEKVNEILQKLKVMVAQAEMEAQNDKPAQES